MLLHWQIESILGTGSTATGSQMDLFPSIMIGRTEAPGTGLHWSILGPAKWIFADISHARKILARENVKWFFSANECPQQTISTNITNTSHDTNSEGSNRSSRTDTQRVPTSARWVTVTQRDLPCHCRLSSAVIWSFVLQQRQNFPISLTGRFPLSSSGTIHICLHFLEGRCFTSKSFF